MAGLTIYSDQTLHDHVIKSFGTDGEGWTIHGALIVGYFI